MKNYKLLFVPNIASLKQITLLILLSLFTIVQPLLAAIPVSKTSESQVGWNALGGLVFRSSAIVEVKLSDSKKAFEVTNVFYGDIKKGIILNFDKCHQIKRLWSSFETLTKFVNMPVVDIPINDDWTIDLKDQREITKFNKPAEDSRYVLLIKFSPEMKVPVNWGFVIQTFGDFFLIQDGKVFRLATSTQRQFWSQFKAAPLLENFMKNLNNEINKRRQFEKHELIEDSNEKLNFLENYLIPNEKYDPYVLTAIEKIVKLENGRNLLIEQVNQGKLKGYYVSEVIKQLGEIKDQNHADWIKDRLNKALVLLHNTDWSFHFARVGNTDEQGYGYSELVSSIAALAKIGKIETMNEVRNGLFWQMAKGFEFHSYGNEPLLTFLEMENSQANHALLSFLEFFKKFEVYPGPSKEETKEAMNKFAVEYKKYAVPFLLWTHNIKDMILLPLWKDNLNEDELWNLALEKLREIVGKDLGKNPQDWWQWYWKNVIIMT